MFLSTLHILLLVITVSIAREKRDRFQVYWNVPSQPCLQEGFPMNLTDAGIIHNTGHEFSGNPLADRVVILYEGQFGNWPELRKEKGRWEWINGGIPQKANLTSHLESVEISLNELIPDENYDGIAIIDMELWRADLDLNFSKKQYFNASLAYAAESRNTIVTPHNYQRMANYGRKDFNKHARTFILQTLKTCKKMRPYARWGFYMYPFVDYNVGKTEKQMELPVWNSETNDRLNWLYNSVDILLPSIYFWKHDGEITNKPSLFSPSFNRARAVLRETKRVRETLDDTEKPILAYTKIELDVYNITSDFYDESHLCASLSLPSTIGVDGVIVWASSRVRDRCAEVSDYVNTLFVPYVQMVKQSVENCSEKMCSSNGVCIDVRDRQNERVCRHAEEEYKGTECKCDAGWEGRNCERAIKADFINYYHRS